MGTLHPIKQNHEENGTASPEASFDSLLAFETAHAIPGRLRVVFPRLMHRKGVMSQVAGYLSLKPGVDRVRKNHFCASVTIEYDPLLVHETSLIEHLESMGEKDLSSAGAGGLAGKPPAALKTPPRNPAVGSSALWTFGGTFFVGMSFLGIIVPGLPTPPFVILAAYCYLRGSERHYRWLMNHPLFGRLVEETESGPRISHKAKKMTVYFLWFSIFLSCIFFVQSMPGRMMLIIMGTGASYYMLRK